MNDPTRLARFSHDLPHYLQQPSSHYQQPSPTTSLLYTLAILYLLALYFNYPIPGPYELVDLLYDALAFALPQRLILSRAQRDEAKELRARGMFAHVRAVKKEALRTLLLPGMSVAKMLYPSITRSSSADQDAISRTNSTTFTTPSSQTSESNSKLVGPPPGLGNWDNSCYQNCILQGLSSLSRTLQPYLRTLQGDEDESTAGSLLTTMDKLNDARNSGRLLWTPRKLKTMSSWMQQDAQEYFSKVLEEVEKEAARAFSSLQDSSQRTTITKSLGLGELFTSKSTPPTAADFETQETTKSIPPRNPLDGLLAQKVTCTECGFSEGLNLIPFNCLTLPLASSTSSNTTDIDECLDEYTKLEEISEVECGKCTLLRAERELEGLLPARPDFRCTDAELDETRKKILQFPPELREESFRRLRNIQRALEDDDFSDKSLNTTCQISKNNRVSSTKTKQAVVARPPKCLVVHVNRSVFDERTGALRKNYARVGYPLTLDLGGWMLDEEGEGGGVEVEGGEKVMYELKAVVTHFGLHENGHYVCYRRFPLRNGGRNDEEGGVEDSGDDEVDGRKEEKVKEQWWRLSDEDVTSVDEEMVLAQGGVFMLFYEKVGGDERPPPQELTNGFAVSGIEAATSSAVEDSVIPSEEEKAAVEMTPLAQSLNHDMDEPLAAPSSSTDPALPSSVSVSGASSHLEEETYPFIEATTEDEADPESRTEAKVDEQHHHPPFWKSETAGSGVGSSPLRMRTARVVPEYDTNAEREKGLGRNGFRAAAVAT